LPIESATILIHGEVAMVGQWPMIRERSTHKLLDVSHLFRRRYVGHHLSITITDHGPRNPVGPSSKGESI
jgi:hypothetical protein